MITRAWSRWACIVVLAAGAWVVGQVILPWTDLGAQALAADPGPDADAPPPPPDQEEPPIPAQEQPEVLTSGPVHEAFAEPVNMDAETSVVVPDEPPAPIDEAPPEERPQGNQYTWVPGYWAWDGVGNHYVWVSACWRLAPREMSWVPGYWNRVDGGWQWVAGFWTSSTTAEIEYCPPPPAVQDLQPPGPPPAADQIWVPSCWYWRDGRYLLRKGYWVHPQAGWVWVPSHYNWTPRGYVFVAGHWDAALERRGILFAPVRFAHPAVRAGFVFSPSVVVDVHLLTENLFTYPRYCHYYFGDYYGDAAVKIGIVPWFDREHIHGFYDPIFVYNRWRNRGEKDWEGRLRHDYQARLSDKSLRPARTYRELQTRVAAMPAASRARAEVARPFSSVVTSRTSTVKFERITTETRKDLSARSSAAHNYAEERSRWEASDSRDRGGQRPASGDRRTAEPPQRGNNAKSERVRITPSPIGARKDAQDDRRDTPGEPGRRR